MPYQPVALSNRFCAHCGGQFTAKDKRRIYCSSSCNTLAWMARNSQDRVSDKVEQVDGDLNFNLNNVGVSAAGAMLVTGAKQVLNDSPFQESVLNDLKSLIYKYDFLLGRLAVSQAESTRLRNALSYADPRVAEYLKNHPVEEFIPKKK